MKKWILILALAVLLFVYSTYYKEQFGNPSCGDYQTCVSCANKSDCTWCSSSKSCVSKTEHTDCEETVGSAAECQVETSDDPNELLYGGQIKDKPAPPMVYMNPHMSYSPETVMANVNELRSEVQMLKGM